MSRVNKRQKADRTGSRLALVAVTVVVVSLAVALNVKTKDDNVRNEQLITREQALDRQLKDQEDRAADLKEERVYVQTKQYIEEVAKEKLGLVYEDEILLKPQD